MVLMKVASACGGARARLARPLRPRTCAIICQDDRRIRCWQELCAHLLCHMALHGRIEPPGVDGRINFATESSTQRPLPRRQARAIAHRFAQKAGATEGALCPERVSYSLGLRLRAGSP